jgi:hypothetical protein
MGAPALQVQLKSSVQRVAETSFFTMTLEQANCSISIASLQNSHDRDRLRNKPKFTFSNSRWIFSMAMFLLFTIAMTISWASLSYVCSLLSQVSVDSFSGLSNRSGLLIKSAILHIMAINVKPPSPTYGGNIHRSSTCLVQFLLISPNAARSHLSRFSRVMGLGTRQYLSQ